MIKKFQIDMSNVENISRINCLEVAFDFQPYYDDLLEPYHELYERWSDYEGSCNWESFIVIHAVFVNLRYSVKLVTFGDTNNENKAV